MILFFFFNEKNKRNKRNKNKKRNFKNQKSLNLNYLIYFFLSLFLKRIFYSVKNKLNSFKIVASVEVELYSNINPPNN